MYSRISITIDSFKKLNNAWICNRKTYLFQIKMTSKTEQSVSTIVFEDDEIKLQSANEFGVQYLEGFSLYPHQVEAVKWMINVESTETHKYGMRGGILALKMGLGKTLCTTTLCMSKYAREKTLNHLYPNLVVCSKTVANEWVRDISKFYGESCRVLYFHRDNISNFDKMTQRQIRQYDIVVVTYETVMSCSKIDNRYERQYIRDNRDRKIGVANSKCPPVDESVVGGSVLFYIPWRRIIADESHRLCNPTSITFAAMMALYSKRKFCLSGTPVRNYSSDMYCQLRFCGYNNTVVQNFNVEVYQRQRLYDNIFCRDYEQSGIVLPDIETHNIEIKLGEREREVYEHYHSQTKREYTGYLIGKSDFSNLLVMFLRLRQLCVCPHIIVKDEEVGEISSHTLDSMSNGLAQWIRDVDGTAGIQSAKMQEMARILSATPTGEKTLIFSSFTGVIDIATRTIDRFLPKKRYLVIHGGVTGKRREDVLERFKTGDYDVLIMSYKVGSEGLNLVEANNIIMFENWWTPVVQQQAQARTHRIGQKNTVNVYKLVVVDSIESNIEDMCDKKNQLIGDFLNGSREKTGGTGLNANLIGKILKSRIDFKIHQN
jgi:SNF2 family DNA or RNA helicase